MPRRPGVEAALDHEGGVQDDDRGLARGRGFEVRIHRLEERRRDVAVVPREQRALVADVRTLELVLTVGFDSRMKRNRRQKTSASRSGAIALDDWQNLGGGVGRGHQANAVQEEDLFEPRPRFPQPIDLLDRAIESLGCTGLVPISHADGHGCPGTGADPTTAVRRGEPPGTRRIDPSQPAAEPQHIEDKEAIGTTGLPQIEDLLGLGWMIRREPKGHINRLVAAIARTAATGCLLQPRDHRLGIEPGQLSQKPYVGGIPRVFPRFTQLNDAPGTLALAHIKPLLGDLRDPRGDSPGLRLGTIFHQRESPIQHG